MQRLVIVLPLVPIRVGDRWPVTEWPLHITVLAPFDTDADSARIAEQIGAAITGCTALHATVGDSHLFGRRQDVPVSVIVPNEPLALLHEQVVAAVRPLGCNPGEPAFTASEFTPHITFKNHGRRYPGDTVVLTQLAVVDMVPRSSPLGRTVLATVSLTGNHRVAT
ncbi:2'-5' RNA ligase family protein [Cryobacterium sp. CG_9.6]|uniref:2'-5' RNA ligase family protein n=1 Tax=Cryobacterium sp. CG_9.6 TaxID=2760710 RepID=UPI0024743D65|nr:2'-5' RNA ligase family protein [Cryobacterium sp. CG_9.6]MDH6236800.1 2'-5' RNA ligase [Cryobacterium sp. CG_9.6]